ncbi:hypothetical protein MKW94_030272 [Papaver nudicaule]|uniref:Uncharacterized protein n=1 Tax=Papaver nudicaule TaxID=74823 RepID=A0AA42ASN4_PAPNU|nr:hypothetical protein [Papaver nudicaule]
MYCTLWRRILVKDCITKMTPLHHLHMGPATKRELISSIIVGDNTKENQKIILIGYVLLALQAHLPSLQPPVCEMSEQFSNCKQVRGINAVVLYIGLYLVAFGEGCFRANLASLGGDQGWDLAFALAAGLTLLGVIVVASGFSFYRNLIPIGSPLTRILQVLVAAFRKRKLQFPEMGQEIHLEYSKENNVGEILLHTEGLAWLDRASISDGKTGDWHLCSVSQVEEVKIVLRMLPVFLSATISYIPMTLVQTLTIQQGGTMNTKLGAIHVPPASLLVIPAVIP